MPSVDRRGRLVCDAAAEAMGAIGGSAAQEALANALSSESADVRRAAAHALRTSMRNRVVLDALRRLVDDPDRDVRFWGIAGLHEWRVGARGKQRADYTDDELLEIVIAAYQSPDLQFGLMPTLAGFMDKPQARELMVAALSDARDLTRDWAIIYLRDADYRAVIPKILEMLRHDPSARVRESAVRALGYYQRPDDTDALIAALDDADPQVRAAAITALLMIFDTHPGPPRAALPRLKELVRDPHGDVGLNARRALRAFGEPVPE